MERIITTKKYIALCLLVIILGVFTKCADEFTSPPTITGNTLVDVAAADTTLEIFSTALVKTGINISLDNINSGLHTVFAPTDSAFRIYFQPIIGGGPGDAAIIAYINTLSATTNPALATFTTRLQYHVVSSKATSTDITNSQVFTTINTARLSLSNQSTIWINGNAGANYSKVRVKDIEGANGVIHAVNSFMTAISTASVVTNTLGITIDYTKAPPVVSVGATAGSNYDIYSNAIKKTGMATTFRPNVAAANLPDFTFFAPDDVAMLTYITALAPVGVVISEATAITYINGLTATDPNLATLTNVVKYSAVTGRKLNTDVSLSQVVTTLLPDKTFTVTEVTPGFKVTDAKGGQATITTANTLTNAGALHRLNKVLEP